MAQFQKGNKLGKKFSKDYPVNRGCPKGHKYPKDRQFTKEHRRKLQQARFGDKNPAWRGGTSHLIPKIRNLFEYRQWRSDVFTRDKYTCQICGDNKGGNLEAHHIRPISMLIRENNIKTSEDSLFCEALWNINNGQTLCLKCHKKTDTYGHNDF